MPISELHPACADFLINSPKAFSNVVAGTSTCKPNSKTMTISRETEKAYSHQHKYHPRIQARALQDPFAHNFPYSFDDVILNVEPIIQEDGSLLYRREGALNKREGFFEIALNKKTNTIFHRTFVRKKR